jgi:UDP-N-acetylmuramoylalanine--D-glutamate ligase
MKVAILGYGIDGASAAGYWHKKGDDITVCDQKTDLLLPEYATAKLGPDYLKDLDQFDILVRSPGVHPKTIIDANQQTPNILDKVTTCINEFFEHSPAPIIGVTGTKGKGTTCTLIHKILLEAGEKSFLGGNIGTVPLDFIHDITPDSWVVLELSNFQLLDFKHSPKIGVCLMLVPEHQDWHSNIKEYFNAKQNLFAHQTEEDYTVYNANNEVSKRVASVSKGTLIPYEVLEENQDPSITSGAYVLGDFIFMGDTNVCDTAKVALLGRHNLENICAAIATTWRIIDGNKQAIQKVASEFSGMEHRLEFVRELSGVKYYNDSFATTPEATIAAIKSFKEPKVIILGGHDKGIPFYDVVSEISHSEIRRVIVIGDTGEKLIELLVRDGLEDKITLGGTTIDQIVKAAHEASQPGDVVLLSTACASFGLFKNYKDRGDQFKQAVRELV